MDQDGVWQPHSHYDDDDEWEETDGDGDEMAVDGPGWADEYQDEDTPTVDEQHEGSAQTAFGTGTPVRGAPDGRPLSPDVPKDVSDEACVGDDMEEDEDNDPAVPWKRFDILSSAPHDHAFYSTAPMLPSKAFLGRLSREYRVLESSLPGPFSIDIHQPTSMSDFNRSQSPSLSAHMKTVEIFYDVLLSVLKILLMKMRRSSSTGCSIQTSLKARPSPIF
jgi:ubiquitin-conjugating enzyme E2 O